MAKGCVEGVNVSLVKVEENKRKATFKNPDNEDYLRVEVDGCLISSGMRCDWLVSEVGNASVLIELKGADVSHACDQLLATVERKEIKPYLEEKIGFLVICSKYPRFDTFVAKAKQRAAKMYKAGFHIVSDKGEFDIERVCAINGPK